MFNLCIYAYLYANKRRNKMNNDRRDNIPAILLFIINALQLTNWQIKFVFRCSLILLAFIHT